MTICEKVTQAAGRCEVEFTRVVSFEQIYRNIKKFVCVNFRGFSCVDNYMYVLYDDWLHVLHTHFAPMGPSLPHSATYPKRGTQNTSYNKIPIAKPLSLASVCTCMHRLKETGQHFSQSVRHGHIRVDLAIIIAIHETVATIYGRVSLPRPSRQRL